MFTTSRLIAFIFVLGATELSLAQSHSVALQETEQAVRDHSLHGPQDQGCPQPGIRTQQSPTGFSGTLSSAERFLSQVSQSLRGEAAALQSETRRCGACRQNNVVSFVTTTRPITVSQSDRCNSVPTQKFRGEFADQNRGQRFVKDVLDGKNSEGQQLAAGCPDPCSYYVYSASTPMSNGGVRINLVVQCGQPRSGGVVFAKYGFGGALVQEWTCSR